MAATTPHGSQAALKAALVNSMASMPSTTDSSLLLQMIADISRLDQQQAPEESAYQIKLRIRKEKQQLAAAGYQQQLYAKLAKMSAFLSMELYAKIEQDIHDLPNNRNPQLAMQQINSRINYESRSSAQANCKATLRRHLDRLSKFIPGGMREQLEQDIDTLPLDGSARNLAVVEISAAIDRLAAADYRSERQEKLRTRLNKLPETVCPLIRQDICRQIEDLPEQLKSLEVAQGNLIARIKAEKVKAQQSMAAT